MSILRISYRRGIDSLLSFCSLTGPHQRPGLRAFKESRPSCCSRWGREEQRVPVSVCFASLQALPSFLHSLSLPLVFWLVLKGLFFSSFSCVTAWCLSLSDSCPQSPALFISSLISQGLFLFLPSSPHAPPSLCGPRTFQPALRPSSLLWAVVIRPFSCISLQADAKNRSFRHSQGTTAHTTSTRNTGWHIFLLYHLDRCTQEDHFVFVLSHWPLSLYSSHPSLLTSLL
ncbi:hypothetical protein BJX68DRAFT_64724 [Aspergillus pseudodeflectus]|uniref:Uncharacterized protein n=1 Tax=Aspergillus pseudodeflectus TaxID=176178 RepID=A0ABR4KJ96_9EURO